MLKLSGTNAIESVCFVSGISAGFCGAAALDDDGADRCCCFPIQYSGFGFYRRRRNEMIKTHDLISHHNQGIYDHKIVI